MRLSSSASPMPLVHACSASTLRSTVRRSWWRFSVHAAHRHERTKQPQKGWRDMWGIIPAAGIGSRIQPLAFSKELLPVGSRYDGATERPRAVSEYLVDRMVRAGVTKLCFVISPGKSDIMNYYGGQVGS